MVLGVHVNRTLCNYIDHAMGRQQFCHKSTLADHFATTMNNRLIEPGRINGRKNIENDIFLY